MYYDRSIMRSYEELLNFMNLLSGVYISTLKKMVTLVFNVVFQSRFLKREYLL